MTVRVGQKHNRVDCIFSAVEEGAVYYTRMKDVEGVCVCVLTIEASHCSKSTVFIFIVALPQRQKKFLPFTSSSSMVVLALSMDS